VVVLVYIVKLGYIEEVVDWRELLFVGVDEDVEVG
jgi:hypothetical protein